MNTAPMALEEEQLFMVPKAVFLSTGTNMNYMTVKGN